MTHSRLVATLVSVTGDEDLGRDAADEACVRAFERWRSGNITSPDAWTYKVGLNHARRVARRRSAERLLLRRLPARHEVPGPSGEVWSIVAGLPPRQRTAVVLRHVADMTEADIAETMGIRRGTVSRTLRDAYASLRDEEEIERPLSRTEECSNARH